MCQKQFERDLQQSICRTQRWASRKLHSCSASASRAVSIAHSAAGPARLRVAGGSCVWQRLQTREHATAAQISPRLDQTCNAVEQGIAALDFLPADGYRDFVSGGLQRVRARIAQVAS